jgi:hypothetical protein
MNGLPREVILAIALVDLPIDLDDKDGVKVRDGYGGSWWFLTCDCDDQYVDIVQEAVSMCTVQQVRELCFLKATTGSGTVLSRATPKCQLVLTQALRFVGRFEFIGKAAIYTDASIGMKEFDALDFGGTSRGGRLQPDEGRRVLLRCYAFEEPFMREVSVVRFLLWRVPPFICRYFAPRGGASSGFTHRILVAGSQSLPICVIWIRRMLKKSWRSQ